LQQHARELRLLSSPEEKKSMLLSLGADRVEVLDFSPEFAKMKAEDYLREVVKERLGGTAVLLGYDNRIGSDCLTPSLLSPVAENLGLDVIVVPPVEIESKENSPVSSTKIRKALSEGKVEEARGMLGYEYFLHGVVVPGKRLGRVLGFPTANMQMYEPLKLVPGRGVYLTEVKTMGSRFYGMTNVGEIVETHIFDFNSDIYGLDITVQFKKRLRDERRFPSVDELRSQLICDEDTCLKLCEDLPRL